jgi:hypothetical protein
MCSDTSGMFKRMLTIAVMIATTTLPLFAAEDPLTNEDIVKMTKAGLSPETIAAKIRASETKFSTDTDSLIALANAGVADSVIRALLTAVPSGKEVVRRETALPRTRASQRKRIGDVTVATPAGGRCQHATLELSANGAKTTGCHETDLNATWKDVISVCYVYAFRSTLVVSTAAGEQRIHTTTPADLKAVAEALRSFAPDVREDASCR